MNALITIDSDDAELAALLRQLEQLVIDAGGFLNPKLRIQVERGEISVLSDASDAELLVRLPAACLIPIDDVSFELHDDVLSVAAYPATLNDSRRAMLDCMLAVYNQGQKVREYRAELPWLAFAQVPALLEMLHRGRADAPKLTRLFEMARSGELDRLAREGFLGSRILKYQAGDGTSARVLMPFIDFFNHHVASPPFGRQQDGLTVTASHPIAGSDECFVRYNALDALDAYLNYGFVDTSAAFLRSVPVCAELQGVGVLDIKSRVAAPRRQPPPLGLADLGQFLPRCQRLNDTTLVAAQLLIPLSAPKAFYRVVGALIQQLSPDLDPPALHAAVDAAVAQIMAANRDYYRALGEVAELHAATLGDGRAFTRLQALICLQQERLVKIGATLSNEWSWERALPGFPYDFGRGLAWS